MQIPLVCPTIHMPTIKVKVDGRCPMSIVELIRNITEMFKIK